MLVIDSSAIAKFFLKERGWEEITKYFYEGITIPFALIELGNVLYKKVLSKEISAEKAYDLLADFKTYAVLLNQNEYLENALQIGLAGKLAFYDSLFIAVAIGEGCDLLTCDEKQAKVAKELGVKVISG